MRWWLLMFALITRPALAQLNESDSIPLQLKLTTTGSYLDGIVSRLLLINRAELAYANQRWGVSSRNDYQYGQTFNRQTESDLLSTNFLYLNPLHRPYPYVMLLMETNYRRKINFRYQPGVGISYNLVREKHSLLKLSLTASFEHSAYGGTVFEHHESNGSRPNVIETIRATGRVFGRQQLLGNKLRLHYECWFQQSVLDGENYRFHTDDSLELPISKRVAVRARLRYTFEHVELVGNKPYDLFITYGISLSNN
ncbi:DUF481 domain-containing protein [Fibrella aquatilis]|uniref:DUF481 domain-containing protein n=1 Tax=Fibrella aquatilis TaxID=2817059 RepID=A0A939JWW8_9BACT|nr:DUF481 domain-containing protein [Fibrella aquatilis]MBO0930429.1 DUF481 domain-containing protein [Fibrella aquatilis]